MTSVEQLKAKRAGTGLRALDRERACPGYTLFAPHGGSTVLLIDLDGTVVHTWQMPYPTGNYGYLTEGGALFYNGKVVERSERFISGKPWKGGAALEMDWEGRVLFEVRHPDHKHEGIRLRNGNVLLLCITALPAEIARRVQGGRAGTEHHGRIYADYLVEMTTAGEVVWEWRSWEHLSPERHPITAEQEEREEWTHGNAVSEMASGDLLLSFRNCSTVAIIERGSGSVVWDLGAPPLAHQHAPVELSNGNILIFDNGTHRLDASMPYSRVIEVERETKQIVWSYQEPRPADFFSPNISNAQRLPNGNTLICEGAFGRLFEVTPERDVVWEYVNPYFNPPGGNPSGPLSNAVFRAYRYSSEAIDRARAAR